MSSPRELRVAAVVEERGGGGGGSGGVLTGAGGRAGGGAAYKPQPEGKCETPLTMSPPPLGHLAASLGCFWCLPCGLRLHTDCLGLSPGHGHTAQPVLPPADQSPRPPQGFSPWPITVNCAE